jgi:ketosteroid isomerase-like protein
MVLFLSLFLSLDACRKSAPPDGVAGSLEPVRADVLAAFQRSREALRRLDVEAYLAGYASGPGLVVQDPAGEFRGREAFERFVREWFAEARKKGPTYALVTSNESVYPLDERTAVVVVHWSAPAGQGPHGSLLVYRQEEGVWRIAAEQSAPLPEVDGAPRDR